MVEVTQEDRQLLLLVIGCTPGAAPQGHYADEDVRLQEIAAHRAAAEQRGAERQRERDAKVAEKKAETILSISSMRLPVMPSPLIAKGRAEVCRDIAQAILQEPTT